MTPDSFSDGGQYTTDTTIINRVQDFIDNKCDIIDIGGQSTRPGSIRIEEEIELNRIIPKLKLN